jgi:hypothetical protein
MARSLNKKYFGNRNLGTTGTSDDHIGGEGVASITLGGVNNSTGYALYDPIDISAPTLPGGVQATARVSALGASNKITAIEVTEKGSGYTAAPTVTESVGGVQGTLTFTAVLTNTQVNSIYTYAKTTSGGTSQLADIIRQVGGRRYKVKTADGTANCKLKGSAVSSVGDMTIIAQDSAGGSYYVTKLTAHKATITRGTGTQFATGSAVRWTFGAAVLNTSVTLDNA